MNRIIEFRRHYKGQVIEEIRTLKIYLEKDENRVSSLQNTDELDTEFIKNSIDKLNVKIAEKKSNLTILQEKLGLIDSGRMDFEIKDIIKKNTDRVTAINDERERKKNIIDARKKHDKKRSQEFYENDKRAGREGRNKEKMMDRSYYHFLKATNTLPNYIKKNLDDMPNNKGYIWKGVTFYGQNLDLPVDNTTIIFDKSNRNSLIIHEWGPEEYKVYEKKGKDKRKLIHREPRKKRPPHPLD